MLPYSQTLLFLGQAHLGARTLQHLHLQRLLLLLMIRLHLLHLWVVKKKQQVAKKERKKLYTCNNNNDKCANEVGKSWK